MKGWEEGWPGAQLLFELLFPSSDGDCGPTLELVEGSETFQPWLCGLWPYGEEKDGENMHIKEIGE